MLDIDLKVKLVLRRKECSDLVLFYLFSFKLLNQGSCVDEVFAYLQVLIAFPLDHFKNEVMPLELDVVWNVEIKLTCRNWHCGNSFDSRKMCLNGMTVLIELMMT